jgi:hypothetical protein
MNRNTKALLWIVAVFAVMAVGLYIGGCGDDEENNDAGTVADTGPANPCDGKKEKDECAIGGTAGVCGKQGTSAELICLAKCTKIGSTEGCSTGAACYPSDDYGNVCLTAGTGKAGSNCSVQNDCAAGNVCLEPTDGGSKACYQVCAKDEDCGGGTCTDTTLGYSVCVAQ